MRLRLRLIGYRTGTKSDIHIFDEDGDGDENIPIEEAVSKLRELFLEKNDREPTDTEVHEWMSILNESEIEIETETAGEGEGEDKQEQE